MTTAALLALGSAALLAARAPASAAPLRWNVTIEGSILQTGDRTTRTTSPGCTLERTERTSESWTWQTAAPVTIGARRGEGVAVELTRGGRRGGVRIPVIVTASATSTGISQGSGADCPPGFGSSSLCGTSQPWTDLSVVLRWNPRSGRLETGPPAATPAALRRHAGGCGTSLYGAASLAERPFPTLVTTRSLAAESLLGGGASLTRQAAEVARRSEPGLAVERRTARALVRLAPVAR